MDESGGSKAHKYDALPNYKVGKTLGIGSFGKVKIAEHVLTGHKVAIKIIKREKIENKEMEEKVKRETKILRLFKHPHIIRLYEVIETATDVFMVMEYVTCGELFDYIVQKGRVKEDEARKFFQQIICGVEYCHKNKVVHRDIKPENILLDAKQNVKIADFGLSNVMRDGYLLKTSCGSPNYAAPEVLSGQRYVGPEVDVWSCGITLYALLCGTLPFDDPNFVTLFRLIKRGRYALPSHLSAGARDLISRIIVVDPMKRLTIPQIRQHPWFQADLPIYLAVPPLDTMQQAKRIDEGILEEAVRMGFERNHLVESIRNRIQNEGTVTYYLLFDNRPRGSGGHLEAVVQEIMETTVAAVGEHLPGYADYQAVGLRGVGRKWTLGFQSGAHPFEILTEVLRALQELNVCWKKIGHFNIKCLWLPSIAGLNHGMFNNPVHNNHIENDGVTESPNVVKFELQLYTTLQQKYLLDIQRVKGPQFLFSDLCASFLARTARLWVL
ncbi:hypothetical protein PTKIN_Ptkin13bG0273700 [Pterospermum kingtungense]